jgi:hypothetical protein
MRMMSPMTRLAEPGYFEWLCGQIEIVGKAKRTYDGLFGMLYATEFEWTVSGDDNRVQDGLDLRGYFSGGAATLIRQRDPRTNLVLAHDMRKGAYGLLSDPD